MAASAAASSRMALFGARCNRVTARTWALVALCIGLNVLEAALVAAFARGGHPALAPQASAVAPFGVFGDLRWVSVYDNSWLVLAAELVGVMLVRGALTGLSIRLAWPAELEPPGLLVSIGRGVAATLLATVLLVPSVTLLFGTAVVPVSWLFLAAVPTALLVALLVHPAAVRGDWWRRVVTLRAIGWVALSFVVLSLASAAIAGSPSWSWPLIAVLTALFNARSWTGLVRAVVLQKAPSGLLPVGALVILVVIGAVLGGAVLGFDASRRAVIRQATKTYRTAATPRARLAVLVVSGYGSAWTGGAEHPLPGNFVEERFSYRGLGRGGQPLSYSSADTAKPIGELDRMFLAQVAALNHSAGRPVAVVAESEGALIAKTALLAQHAPGVVALVMASPLQNPGRVWYPTTSTKGGWGLASNGAMRLLGEAFQGVAPIELSPDNPFIGSLDGDAPILENAMACPIAGVREAALLPLADATVAPAAEAFPFPTVVLPAFHGGLLGTVEGQRAAAAVLLGRPLASAALLTLADKAIRYAATAWQVPSLAPSDFPSSGELGPSGLIGCRQVGAELRHALRTETT